MGGACSSQDASGPLAFSLWTSFSPAEQEDRSHLPYEVIRVDGGVGEAGPARSRVGGEEDDVSVGWALNQERRVPASQMRLRVQSLLSLVCARTHQGVGASLWKGACVCSCVREGWRHVYERVVGVSVSAEAQVSPWARASVCEWTIALKGTCSGARLLGFKSQLCFGLVT